MITLDWMLPGCDGLEIAKAVREAGLETTILMLSALAEGIQGFYEVGAWCLVALVGQQAAAALLHRFVRRDDVLEAIAPILRRRPM